MNHSRQRPTFAPRPFSTNRAPRIAFSQVQAPFITGLRPGRSCVTRAERSQGGTVSHRSRYVPHGPDAAAVQKGTDLDTSKPERCGDPGLVGIDHWLGAQTGVRFGWIFFHLYTHTHTGNKRCSPTVTCQMFKPRAALPLVLTPNCYSSTKESDTLHAGAVRIVRWIGWIVFRS